LILEMFLPACLERLASRRFLSVGLLELSSETELDREREREREREGKRGINKMSYDDAAVFLLQIESNAEPSCNAAKIINRKSKRKKTS